MVLTTAGLVGDLAVYASISKSDGDSVAHIRLIT